MRQVRLFHVGETYTNIEFVEESLTIIHSLVRRSQSNVSMILEGGVRG